MNVPNIYAFPKSPIHETNSVVLTCYADSTESVNYTWHKDKIKLLWTSKENVILKAKGRDTGNYTCTTENRFGRRNSTDLFLQVFCEYLIGL